MSIITHHFHLYLGSVTGTLQKREFLMNREIRKVCKSNLRGLCLLTARLARTGWISAMGRSVEAPCEGAAGSMCCRKGILAKERCFFIPWNDRGWQRCLHHE